MKYNEIVKLVNDSDNYLQDIFKKVDDNAYFFSNKILDAFHKANVNESAFASSTGYGYSDFGRDTIEKIYSSLFGSEDALVRSQFISASHALNVTFFSLLRPGDTLLSITGSLYDTMTSVIGLDDNPSSLKSFGINYEQIDLKDSDFDFDKIKDYLSSNKVKVVHIQRSKGYSLRKSLTIDKVGKVCRLIKNIDPNIIIMVDNCYCELVEKLSPIEAGADIAVGSLIKNLGGGIAPNGAYVVGKKNLINLVGERLTLPGEGKDVGPTLGINKSILQGLYLSPTAISSALKTAILTSYVMEKLGFDVSPKYDEKRADIVQNIIFNDDAKLIKYVQGIQKGSAIDANAIPVPSDIAGYKDKIIMASGSFVEGSSIELSCDGPIRSPYVAYQQGSLTYEYGKIGVITAIDNLLNN